MGFLSRLFRRVQEEPLAPPAEPEPLEPEPKPVESVGAGHAPPGEEPEPAEPEPVGAGYAPPAEEPEPAEPEPVGAGLAPPAEEPARPEPAPEPAEPGPPSELSMTLDEVTAALRAAGSDGIRIGFLSREYLRASDEERSGARRRLVAVLTEQLRTRGLLAEDGRFELMEEPSSPTPGAGNEPRLEARWPSSR
jgi:hypothetical protein